MQPETADGTAGSKRDVGGQPRWMCGIKVMGLAGGRVPVGLVSSIAAASPPSADAAAPAPLEPSTDAFESFAYCASML